jgi:LAO/AO transport system kinase
LNELAEGVLNGQRIAVSKAISSIENRDAQFRYLLREIYPHTGKGFVVGITGPPGTGKSSLVNALARYYRSLDKKVAVLAVDPSSPSSGGAILGDRVRMLEHALDPSVYIRSMASRGDEGGLSRAARNAIRVLDAAGFDYVLVETVGTGQAEVEIVGVADIVVVVLMPELGDEIQAVKAGLMEIADIFAVNKSDLPGSDKVIYNLHSILASHDGLTQTALKVSAKAGTGIAELARKIDELRSSRKVGSDVEARVVRNLRSELLRNLDLSLAEAADSKFKSDPQFSELVRRVAERKLDPESATNLLLERFMDPSKPRRGKN